MWRKSGREIFLLAKGLNLFYHEANCWYFYSPPPPHIWQWTGCFANPGPQTWEKQPFSNNNGPFHIPTFTFLDWNSLWPKYNPYKNTQLKNRLITISWDFYACMGGPGEGEVGYWDFQPHAHVPTLYSIISVPKWQIIAHFSPILPSLIDISIDRLSQLIFLSAISIPPNSVFHENKMLLCAHFLWGGGWKGCATNGGKQKRNKTEEKKKGKKKNSGLMVIAMDRVITVCISFLEKRGGGKTSSSSTNNQNKK